MLGVCSRSSVMAAPIEIRAPFCKMLYRNIGRDTPGAKELTI